MSLSPCGGQGGQAGGAAAFGRQRRRWLARKAGMTGGSQGHNARRPITVTLVDQSSEEARLGEWFARCGLLAAWLVSRSHRCARLTMMAALDGRKRLLGPGEEGCRCVQAGFEAAQCAQISKKLDRRPSSLLATLHGHNVLCPAAGALWRAKPRASTPAH